MDGLTTLLFMLLGAYLYRWRGGAKINGHLIGPPFRRPFKQLFFNLPLIATLLFQCYGYLWSAHIHGLHAWALAAGTLMAIIWCVAWECSGHANFQNMGTVANDRPPERCEYAILPLKKHLPEFWYDVLGMSVSGLYVTILPGIMLSFLGSPFTSLIILLSGLSKGLAYLCGWVFYRLYPHWGWTEYGEFLTGYYRYGLLAIYWGVS